MSDLHKANRKSGREPPQPSTCTVSWFLSVVDSDPDTYSLTLKEGSVRFNPNTDTALSVFRFKRHGDDRHVVSRVSVRQGRKRGK